MTDAKQDTATPVVTTTLDCLDADRLARFWCAALGYQELARAGSFVVLGPEPGMFKLSLQQVPETRAGKNRMHMDLWVGDIDSEAKRLEALGATRLHEDPVEEHGFRWYRMSDPEGNDFCVANAPQ
jgi:catechol 2,3-dioxygenase-like lactoylglutathione lyase family enzyme